MYIISTSSRNTRKRCLRKAHLSSRMERNLTPKGGTSQFLYFGSGFHFSLEDYHGYNNYNDARIAYLAYLVATTKKGTESVPENLEELMELGLGMLGYYIDEWLPNRDFYETMLLENEDGELYPAVEIEFALDLGLTKRVYEEEWDYPRFKDAEFVYYEPNCELEEAQFASGYVAINGEQFFIESDPLTGKNYFEEPVVYHGTIDRIVVDGEGRVWIQDYKTASSIDLSKVEFDEQISAYLWAIEQYLGIEVEGMLYTQFKKSVPNEPKVVKGGEISTDKRQSTTAKLYAKALCDKYGDSILAPQKNRETLRYLMEQESEFGDKFITLQEVRRTLDQKEATYRNILAEAEDTINSKYRYPNHTADCSWDCPYKQICHGMEDGLDAESIIDENFKVADNKYIGEEEAWREFLPVIPENIETLEEKIEYLKSLIRYPNGDLDIVMNIMFEGGEI